MQVKQAHSLHHSNLAHVFLASVTGGTEYEVNAGGGALAVVMLYIPRCGSSGRVRLPDKLSAYIRDFHDGILSQPAYSHQACEFGGYRIRKYFNGRKISRAFRRVGPE